MLDEQCWAFAQSHLKLNQTIWKVYYVHVPDVLHCCKKKKGEMWSLSPLGSVCKRPFWWILMDYQYVNVNSLLNTMIKVRSSESAPLSRYFHVQYEHYSYTCIMYMYESTNLYCWASLNWESLCRTGVKENKKPIDRKDRGHRFMTVVVVMNLPDSPLHIEPIQCTCTLKPAQKT